VSDYKDRILTELIETGAERATTTLPRGAASRPRRRVAVVAIGCAVVAVVGLMVARGRDGGIDVVSKAAAAISPRSGEILHYRLDGVRIVTPYYEEWQIAGPPKRSRGITQGSDRSGDPCLLETSVVLDESGTSEVRSSWDATTNTVYVSPPRALPGPPILPDAFVELQKHLAEGDLVERGRDTINGRAAILLEPRDVSGLSEEGRFGDLTQEFAYYVDATTYAPVRWVVSRKYGQYYDVPVFEYLAANPANLALVSVDGAHPGSRITGASPPSTGCGAG
jgi:hypothetical protein